MIQRAVIPSILVLLFTAVPFLWFGHKPGNEKFDSHLAAIANQEPFEPHFQSALSYIQFLQEAKRADPSTAARQQVADHYFELGEAILKRNDPVYLDQAIDCYQHSVEVFESLRHGWPYYQLGFIHEQKQQYEQAKSYYKQVTKFDFGELALRAGYQQCRMDLQMGRDISPIFLYDFLRYSLVGTVEHLNKFHQSALSDYAPSPQRKLFIHAFFKHYKQDHEKALSLMNQYIQSQPSDYSANYYRDFFENRFRQSLYPADGNLLVDPHTPLALRNGSIRLLEKGELQADFYLNPNNPNSDYKLHLICKNPNQLQGNLVVTLNQDTFTHSMEGEAIEMKVSFDAQSGKNVLQLYFFLPSPLDDPLQNWLEIQSVTLRSQQERGPS